LVGEILRNTLEGLMAGRRHALKKATAYEGSDEGGRKLAKEIVSRA